MVTLLAPRRPDLAAQVRRIGDAAADALLAEARLPGKPGLVGPDGSAGHTDMALDTLVASAQALRPWFEDLARLGAVECDDAAARREAGTLGRRAEEQMRAVTGGVNTHRGALWAVGMLCVGAGRVTAAREVARGLNPRDVAREAAAVASHPDPDAEERRRLLPGGIARRRYVVGGAVTQATGGFPHALAAASSLHRGLSPLHALLDCMAHLDDTCLLHRGGPDALTYVQRASAEVLDLGMDTPAGASALAALDATLTSRRLSPGGSADMLAAALFLTSLADDPEITPEESCKS